jgi:hypothetical protein
VVVTLAEGEELLVDGSPVTGEHRFGALPERSETTAVSGTALLTEYATCPLPPRENRLPVAVTAGELDPHQRG